MRILLVKILMISIFFMLLCCQTQNDYDIEQLFSNLRGDYLGQVPPGDEPRIFAPSIISYGHHELGLTISPDGNDIFYTTANNRNPFYVIIHVKRTGETWTAPEVSPFSGYYSDYNPAFSPDGKKLYFSSDRPVANDSSEKSDYDIWVVEKSGESWSEPVHLGEPVNTDETEINPAVAANGNLYYQALYNENTGFDIFLSRFKAGNYSEAVRIPEPVSTVYNEGGPFIGADESYILFHSSRPGGMGKSDLYISFRADDNTWLEPINLGAPINTLESETLPFLSSDGKYLIYTGFSSFDPDIFKGKPYRELLQLYNDPLNGAGTLFWVNADFIKNIKEKSLE